MTIPDSDENRAWNHILEGNYDSAIAIFERLLPNTTRLGEWNNYGTALLLRGDAEAAEQAYRYTRQLPRRHNVINLKVGAALWCQGKRAEACADWRRELVRIRTGELEYYDASGLFAASLLWWPSLWMEEPEMTHEVLAQIRSIREQEVDHMYEWPVLLASWILGEAFAQKPMWIPDQKLISFVYHGTHWRMPVE